MSFRLSGLVFLFIILFSYLSCTMDTSQGSVELLPNEVKPIPASSNIEHQRDFKQELLNIVTNNRDDDNAIGLISDIFFNSRDPGIINCKDQHGSTPLILACSMNKTKIAKYLISLGADLHIKDKLKHDALYWAKAKENKEIEEAINNKNNRPSISHDQVFTMLDPEPIDSDEEESDDFLKANDSCGLCVVL